LRQQLPHRRSKNVADLIHEKRPQAAFLTYIQGLVDGITSESNTAIDRALPMWPYSASDNVNRARNSGPSKMAFNLAIGFVDIPYESAARVLLLSSRQQSYRDSSASSASFFGGDLVNAAA
jgi:hypothetical protein